jgi:flagellar motor switch protein FliM
VNAPVSPPAGSVLPSHGREKRRRTGLVTPYDFRRPVKLSRENARTLQIACETFARQASIVLTSAMRSVCAVEVSAVEQRTYTEYVDSLPETTHLTLFTVEPIQGKAVLELPIPVVMTCVDRLLGGPGPVDQPERPLTDLEASVVGNVFDRLVAEVRYALSTLVGVEPVIVGTEYSPQLAQIANATDAMVVARFVLRRDGSEHAFSLAMSFAGVLPYLTASGGSAVVSDRERLARAEAQTMLAAGIQEVPVDVAVRFRGTVADPVELSGLRVGDVVRLRHPAQAPLDVTAADIVFAHATPGAQGTRLAARVVATPSQERA